MSKINAIQAEALKSTPENTSSVEANKPATKAAPASKATVNPTAAKTNAVKPATAAKPAAKVAAKASAASSKKPAEKTAEKNKVAKEKTPKLKMERDSFTMPKTEYAQFSVLKERLTKLGQPAKKSELLRAGIMQLSAMTDAALKAAMGKVPAIKTGRPKKK
ncbi:hypothetical protein [Methylotenera mobilis]|uniref:Uncharacterized protein n=1 Tax=Methylotenera mobilis (strain JLW8 / ATCC BAA-1282 / DSM 17540) TaxID=583345 RepID=C6WX76_METML|nr:hypothetical protein [Methylotenera mobilis]ACT48525.1 conserved hypothetical protein [Methylotenera mobilis JLW8]